jgi:hypothetical protein
MPLRVVVSVVRQREGIVSPVGSPTRAVSFRHRSSRRRSQNFPRARIYERTNAGREIEEVLETHLTFLHQISCTKEGARKVLERHKHKRYVYLPFSQFFGTVVSLLLVRTTTSYIYHGDPSWHNIAFHRASNPCFHRRKCGRLY